MSAPLKNKRTPETQWQLDRIDGQIRWMTGMTIAFGIAGALVGAWAVYRVGLSHAELATLGTLLQGTVGPIWSIAGLLLIYVAFLGQRRQIVLQEEGIDLNRQELEDTREELRGQREQLELQRKEMEIQNAAARHHAFEQSFFALLQFQRKLIGDLSAQFGTSVYHGQEAFEVAAGEIAALLEREHPSDEQCIEALSSHFHDICLTSRSDFGSYFRTMYHILRHIDESGVQGAARYASLMRAQLSNAELILLVADGLSDVGRAKFKPLIESYELLEPVRLPASMKRFRSFYAPSAFGG